MLLTDRQTDEWVRWFIKKYEPHCTRTTDGRLSIPIIYSEDPEKTEKEHADMWLKEIKKLMWRNANKEYTHRGWRTETYAQCQFSALWLYNWPIFKHISEKEDATNKNSAPRQKVLWNLFRGIRKK